MMGSLSCSSSAAIRPASASTAMPPAEFSMGSTLPPNDGTN
jgi:hypothetical protein